jgi:predicted PurR-regulated permease PerM
MRTVPTNRKPTVFPSKRRTAIRSEGARCLGLLAGLLNFVPYLGPAINIAIVGLAALVSFESVGYALLAPLAYLILNGIESSVITPTVMGWRLRLNPVAIIIALTFWTWTWGVTGSLLAVPLLAAIKITCDRIQPLQPIGVLLG